MPGFPATTALLTQGVTALLVVAVLVAAPGGGVGVGAAAAAGDGGGAGGVMKRRSDEERLLEYLFTEYNPSARPVLNSSKTVQVDLMFSLMHIQELVSTTFRLISTLSVCLSVCLSV